MQKNCMAVIFCIALVLGLTGCENGSISSQEQSQEVIQTTEESEEIIQNDDAVLEEETEELEIEETKEDVKEDTLPADFVLIEGTLETIDYDSQAIADNLIEENTEQKLYVYLPPTYNTSDKIYPVVYFFHGFGDSAGVFIRTAKNSLDPAFSINADKEFIVVAVDGSNSTGGSYYVNSPVIGQWEDYATQEVVTYIDENYRTIPKADSRGVCGFSMGGFAALNLAFLHPDIYGAVYAMSPGVIAEGKIQDALTSWRYDSVFLKAYSYAFVYNTTPPYEDIPACDGTETDTELLARWESGFGNWEEKLDAYLALNTPLKAVGLSYGINDSYKWIAEGTPYLSELLNEKKIEHILFSFEGGHSMPSQVIDDHLLPFFQEALVWE